MRTITNIILISAGFLAGCGLNRQLPVPVIDILPPSRQEKTYHRVQSGETLYMIAWRYNRDVRHLLAINKISDPYVIFPGDVIKLTEKKASSIKIKEKKQIKSDKYASSLQQSGHHVTSAWRWPTEHFSFKENRKKSRKISGIDIFGKLGDPINATASGTVVYSGSGLRGYGRLIIIKHSDEYLSAYAHNSRLLVSEGAYVKVGQKIAEMGIRDNKQAVLHFEIRQHGLPVNPLPLLAKR